MSSIIANNNVLIMESNSKSNEHPLSLLRTPLTIPSEETISSSSDIMAPTCAPSSFFEEPFDNTDMEPLPFRYYIPVIVEQEPSSSLSPLKSSFKRGSEGLDLGRSLASLLFNPIDNDIFHSKRSSDDLLSGVCVPSHSNKRQRSSPCSDEDEKAFRFRPYQDRQWRAMFKKLIQYKLQHGHCCVPHSYQAEPKLARWVKRQRYQHKKFEDKNPSSTMTPSRIKELNSLGFVWHSHASAWQTKFNELKAFQELEGHCNVPSNYSKNLPLAAWIQCQRRHARMPRSGINSSPMTQERYELLESLGFDFENNNKSM